MNSPTARKSCYERSSSQQPECHTISCTTREIRVVHIHAYTSTLFFFCDVYPNTRTDLSPATFSYFYTTTATEENIERFIIHQKKEPPTYHLIDYVFNFHSLFWEKEVTLLCIQWLRLEFARRGCLHLICFIITNLIESLQNF